MEKKITIVDIARLVGVSKSTISNFLNGRYNGMSEKTRKRIEEVIGESNYRPNRQARSLKSKYSSIIGISVADISNSYTARLLKGITDRIANTQYYTITMNSNLSQERERNNIDKLLNEQVDGILIQPLRETPEDYAELSLDFPVVQIDRYVSPLAWPAVVSNNIMESKKLTELVLKKNYKRIIVLTPPIESSSPRTKRYHGILEALSNTDVVLEVIITSEIRDVVANDLEIWEKVKRLLEKPIKTAIYAFNGGLLYGLLKFLTRENIKVPDQVGVVGYDDGAFAELISPGITSIKQNPIEIGYKAADLLIRNIENKEKEIKINIVDSQINLRQSL